MRVKLQDVCRNESSSLMLKQIHKEGGDYPVYGASGLVGYADFFQQDKPYVAVVKDGAGIGRTMLLPAKSSVIGTMQYLIPRDTILPEYLYFVVKNMRLERFFSGATIPHIYFKTYKHEQFNLVDLKSQKKIVFVLGKVENLISDRERELALLDDLVKSRF
ncbi:MAG: restriction endonuclease subunit S, partial [Thermoguttaceae bacterium]|nr:restriction endonuclease subunit S [Thermoguttaceae bacterium]